MINNKNYLKGDYKEYHKRGKENESIQELKKNIKNTNISLNELEKEIKIPAKIKRIVIFL